MKFSRNCILIIGAVIAFSCQKANEESIPIVITNPNPPASDPDVIQFKATLEAEYTRVSMPYRTFKATWDKGDLVSITDGRNVAVYQAFYGGSSETILVHYSGDTLSLNSNYKAFYPYERIDGQLPSRQEIAGFDKAVQMPMAAESNCDDLSFKNECGIFRMNLFSQVGSIILKSIEVKSSSFNEGSPFIVDCGKGVKLYNRGDQFIPVSLPEGTYSDISVTFHGNQLVTDSSGEEMEGESVCLTTALSESISISKSCLITQTVEILPPPIDLSLEGTANCYMTTAPGLYKFKATRGCESLPLEGITGVHVIWETQQTKATPKVGSEIASAYYTADDGCINFVTATPYSIGNALIAAVDCDGNILWSWHIWLQTQGAVSNIIFPTGITVMNVDLGTATRSALLYQFGRKEPFVGSTSSSEKSGVSTSFWERIDGTGTIQDAIRYPLYAYLPSDSNEWSNSPELANWVSKDGTKTIYDPCPAGYKVPFVSADTFEKAGLTLEDSWWSNHEGRGSYAKPTHTFNLSNGTIDHYTRTGTIRNQEFYPNPIDVYVWTASRNDVDGQAYMISVKETSISLIGSPRNNMANVRCQKIEEQ